MSSLQILNSESIKYIDIIHGDDAKLMLLLLFADDKQAIYIGSSDT